MKEPVENTSEVSPEERAERQERAIASFDMNPRIAALIEEQGISHLYPPQAQALPHVLSGSNLFLSIPTASGKSLIAYIAILEAFMRGGRSLYIVPLRALAAEKVEELKRFESLGLRVGVSVGDYDSPESRMLENADVVVATSEKADSILRHIPGWLSTLQVVVADEVHLLNDRKRGPTLEVLLARIRQHNTRHERTGRGHPIQIISLSATVKNSSEMAEWLQSVHVRSEWRPVQLREGIFHGGSIHFIETGKGDDPSSEKQSSDQKSAHHTVRKASVPPNPNTRDPLTLPLATQIIEQGGQCLIFVNTRRSTEGTAAKLAPAIGSLLDDDTKRSAAEAGSSFLSRSETTSMGTKLFECFSSGVAFHHAGLANEQRSAVEGAFKKGLLKCIVATPTLAAGINLPARRVVIRDTTRFDGGMNRDIPAMEIKQMMGRAGRPHLDPYGEAIILAGTRNKFDMVRDRYILGESEAVESKLGAEPALRMHILSAVAAEQIQSHTELMEFIRHTFHAHQYGEFVQHAGNALAYLEEQGLITVEGPSVRTRSGDDTDGKGTVRETRATTLFDFGDARKKQQPDTIISEMERRGTKQPADLSLDSGFQTANDLALQQTGNAVVPNESNEWGLATGTNTSDSFTPASRYLDSAFHASAFGKRTAELYIDPYSAVVMKDALENPAGLLGDATPLAYLCTIAATTDLLPLFLRRGDREKIDSVFEERMDELFFHPFMDSDQAGKKAPSNAEFEEFLSHLKTALMLEKWIGEETEDAICKLYDIGPGDLRNRVEVAEWLLFSMREIATLRKKRADAKRLADLVRRMRHGVKAELLPLLKLKGVGRVRARTFFKAGFTDREALRSADVRVLAKLPGIGDVLAAKILEQVGGV